MLVLALKVFGETSRGISFCLVLNPLIVNYTDVKHICRIADEEVVGQRQGRRPMGFVEREGRHGWIEIRHGAPEHSRDHF